MLMPFSFGQRLPGRSAVPNTTLIETVRHSSGHLPAMSPRPCRPRQNTKPPLIMCAMTAIHFRVVKHFIRIIGAANHCASLSQKYTGISSASSWRSSSAQLMVVAKPIDTECQHYLFHRDVFV